MATNIEITAQLNKMLAEQNQLLLVQAKIQKSQLALTQAMAEAMGNVDVSAMNDSLKAVTEQLNAAEEAAKRVGQTTQSSANTTVTAQVRARTEITNTADALQRAAEEAEKYNIVAASVEGAIRGFQLSFNVITSLVGILGQAARGVGQFAMSVLRFPLSIWNFLFSKATSGGGGGDLRQTLENIRKEFGDLSKSSSKAIIDMAKSMKGELANTGLSVYRTFGNLAERLKTITELAKALGPLFINVVQRGLIKSAEATLAFQKGLGLSNEQMKTLARTALIRGTSIDESLREMSNYAIQLGDAFGMNAMEISRDMAELEGDMKHFGGLTRKELGETVVYAKKLGIEVKSLAGIMDTFDTFDTAAEAAARLNQQFGIQVDAMRLMKAESPAERLEELRKGLERTGRSFESLDRRSQQYLATTIGMSQEEAALAFAQANRGLSLDQIKKKSAEAEKKQLTQAEALQKLAGSIERLVKGGGGGVKSLFEAFVDGFQRAIFRSREFRQIMRNIRIMLRQTRIAGMQVGRAFLDMMPGFKGILVALGDLFNPTRWKRTLNKVVDAFKSFFKDLQTNPEAGLKNLFDNLKKAFFDHFDASSGAGRKLIENFKLFFTTVLKAIVGGLNALIPIAFEALTKLIKGINGFLKGDVGLPIDTDSIGGQIMQVLSQLGETIKEAWPPLWEAMKELFTTVFNKLSDWYDQNRMLIWGFLFGPAIIRSLIGGISAAIGQAMIKGVIGGLTSTAVQTTVSSVATNAIPAALQGASAAGTAGAGAAQAVSGAAGAGGAAAITSAIPVFAALTLLIPVIAAMMVAAVVMLGNFSIAQVGVTVAAMAAGELLLLGMVGVVQAVGIVGAELAATGGIGAGAAGVGLLALGGMIIGLAYVMKTAISEFDGVSSENIKKAVVALGAGELLLFGAAGLIGAIAIVSLLIPAAPVLIAGFVALTGIVFGVADMIKSIIISIRNIPDLGAGFETKLGAFLSVFEAVTDFMRILNDIMISSAIITLIRTSPLGALMTLLTGASSPFEELTTFVSTFGPIIQSLVTSVIANTAGLTKERIKALEVLAPVIEAIGTLIEAMQPPTNIALIGSVMPVGTIVALTSYFEGIKNMLTGDGGLVNSVLNIITSIGDIPVTTFNVEAIRAFTSIIGGLGTFIGSFAELTETGVLDTLLDERSRLMSGPQYFFFKAIGNEGAAARAIEDPAVKRLNGIVTFMKNMIYGLQQSGIIKSINEIINNASSALSGLTKEQIAGIAPITSMISSIFSFVGQVGENFKVDPDVAKAISEGTSQEGIEAARDAVLNLPANLASSIKTVIDSIKENIAPIIRTLTGSVAGFSTADITKASKAGEAITSIISGISSFMTSIKELGSTEITEAMEDGSTVTATLFDTSRIGNMITAMNNIVAAVFGAGNAGMIQTIVASLLGSGITRLPRGIAEKAKAIVDILGLVGVVAEPGFQENLKNLTSTSSSTPTVIETTMKNASEVIKSIVTSFGGMFEDGEFTKGIRQFTKGNIDSLGNIQGFLTQVSNVVQGISIGLLTQSITAGIALTGIKDNIITIVNEANSIFDTINRINDFNVPTTLQKLGNYLGLGGNNTITLKNENVSINVTVDVHIDARELERVLLERPRTRFQERAAPTTAGGQ